VQERQPAPELSGLRPQAPPLVFGKRALLEFDRPRMLAAELQRLPEAVENLRGLAEPRSLLKEGPGVLPVRCRERLAAEAEEFVSRRRTHRRPCSHERAVGLPRIPWMFDPRLSSWTNRRRPTDWRLCSRFGLWLRLSAAARTARSLLVRCDSEPGAGEDARLSRVGAATLSSGGGGYERHKKTP
jgi:hypothetical protein